MTTLLITILVIAAIIGLLFLYGISAFNSLVHYQAMAKEAFSSIDVQLKRRYDLIPNLVAVVDQYRIHERDVLENVTKMRSLSMSATTVDQKADAERGLTGALKTLFAVAENYPQLKANENFLTLQSQLAGLETEIQLARRYYNGATRNYNVSARSFPANVIASLFGFSQMSYFELDNNSEREVPKVKF